MYLHKEFSSNTNKMHVKTETRTFEIKVHTGSSKRGISIKNDMIDLYTPKRPVNGKANLDAIKIISNYWGVPKSCISLIKGAASKNKVFAVKGCLKTGNSKLRL